MLRSPLLPVLSAVLWAGCGNAPDWYAPPPQRAPLSVPPPTPFGYFVSMSDPESSAYVVQGFADKSEGQWRWAYDRPVLRFWVPDLPRLNFEMEFALPERTFNETGPVTLTYSLNGHLFDRVRYDQPGQHRYSREAPGELLRRGAMNTVAIEPDKFWVSKEDGTRLSFILVRAGFVE